MIRYWWQWDDRDGQILQRFSRTLGLEAWLVGYERPDPRDERYVQEGSMVRDLVTRTNRRMGCIIIGFTVDPRRVKDGFLLMSNGGTATRMNLPLERVLRLALPGDGSFPAPDALAFLRSLGPDPDETVTLLRQVPASHPEAGGQATPTHEAALL